MIEVLFRYSGKLPINIFYACNMRCAEATSICLIQNNSNILIKTPIFCAVTIIRTNGNTYSQTPIGLSAVASVIAKVPAGC